MNSLVSRACFLAGGLFLAMLLAALPGCGGDGPEVYPVKGRVTRDGKPVSGLQVHFMPDGGRPSWGITDRNGEFELDYTREEKGARVGRHRVWVVYDPPRPNNPGEEADMIAKGTLGKPPAELADLVVKYGSLETTPLVVEITEWDQFVELKLD